MMMLRLALRSLLAHPARSAVLAGGFGLGVSVMANLLGIGEVMLEQARSPALAGGGDLVVVGDFGEVQSAQYILSGVMATPPLQGRARTVSPSLRSVVYLLRDDDRDPVALEVRGAGFRVSRRRSRTRRRRVWRSGPTPRLTASGCRRCAAPTG